MRYTPFAQVLHVVVSEGGVVCCRCGRLFALVVLLRYGPVLFLAVLVLPVLNQLDGDLVVGSDDRFAFLDALAIFGWCVY